jgi:hypothetical protein
MKTTLAIIFALVLSVFTVNLGLATTLKCTVDKVDGEKVVLNCGDDAAKIEAGMNVKVKTVKTTGAVEGC